MIATLLAKYMAQRQNPDGEQNDGTEGAERDPAAAI
jgi:hypothetical protein